LATAYAREKDREVESPTTSKCPTVMSSIGFPSIVGRSWIPWFVLRFAQAVKEIITGEPKDRNVTARSVSEYVPDGPVHEIPLLRPVAWATDDFPIEPCPAVESAANKLENATSKNIRQTEPNATAIRIAASMASSYPRVAGI